MFCKKCGSSLTDGALFCKKCGNKIAADQPKPEADSTVTAPAPAPAAPAPVAQQPVAPQYTAPPVAPAPVAQQPVTPQYNAPPVAPPPVAQQPVAPQYTAPPPVAQQPVAPQYTAPQYNAPQYGTPVRPAPKKIPTVNIIIGIVCLLAGVVIFIITMVKVHNMKNSEPANSNYGQQSGVAVNTSGGNAGGNIGGNIWGNTGGNAGESTGGNAGESTGGEITQPPAPKEQYTSPKTGKVFTVPNRGYASVTYNGQENTVTAGHVIGAANSYQLYDNFFIVRFDTSVNLSFSLTESSDWKAGKSLALGDMKADSNYVGITGVYGLNDSEYIFSNLGNYRDYFKDAQFTIIERDASTNVMKWYFYVKTSDGSSTLEFEGVVHTVGIE